MNGSDFAGIPGDLPGVFLDIRMVDIDYQAPRKSRFIAQDVNSSVSLNFKIFMISPVTVCCEPAWVDLLSVFFFRADLYHRLNVYPIKVPALRERKEDIAILAEFFITQAKRRLVLREIRICDAALQRRNRYSWPGNVRELENILSRAVLKASQGTNHEQHLKIQPEHLAGDLGSAVYVPPVPEYEAPVQAQENLSFRDEIKSFQIRLIQSALDRNDGNGAATARQLNMHRSNLHNLATRLGIRAKK